RRTRAWPTADHWRHDQGGLDDPLLQRGDTAVLVLQTDEIDVARVHTPLEEHLAGGDVARRAGSPGGKWLAPQIADLANGGVRHELVVVAVGIRGESDDVLCG